MELSAVGFISPVRESFGFTPVLSWLHPARIPKSKWASSPVIFTRWYPRTTLKLIDVVCARCSLNSAYAKNQLCRCPTCHINRDVSIRSLQRRPYRMHPTAVGFTSLTTEHMLPIVFISILISQTAKYIWTSYCVVMYSIYVFLAHIEELNSSLLNWFNYCTGIGEMFWYFKVVSGCSAVKSLLDCYKAIAGW